MYLKRNERLLYFYKLQSICIFEQGRLYTISFPIASPNCKKVANLFFAAFGIPSSQCSRPLCPADALQTTSVGNSHTPREKRSSIIAPAQPSDMASRILPERAGTLPVKPSITKKDPRKVRRLLWSSRKILLSRYPFIGTKPTRSLTTSPPMMRPTTEGTKALEPGTERRRVHLRWVPGGQMQ